MRNEAPNSVETTEYDDAHSSSATGVNPHMSEREGILCLERISIEQLAEGLHIELQGVITARRAADALCILRAKENELDLILTESRLLDMGMYELLETLGQISNLPIGVISADNGDNAILGGFFKGVAFYLAKPLTMNDVKNLWQFAYMRKREKKITVKEVGSFCGEPLLDNASGEDLKCVVRTGKQGSRLGKGKEKRDMDKEDDLGSEKKKRKSVWTNDLHYKFSQAVKVLGVDDAHPKKILDLMNVQGLKKEQVSSHLQKYRISLKKRQDAYQKTMRIDSAESSSSLYPISTANLQAGFVSYFQQNRNGPMSTPSHGSICLSNRRGSNPNGMSNFIYKQSAPQNYQPHTSSQDQFGFGIAPMGESFGFDERGSMPLCNVRSFGLSAIDCPTLSNNQQGQFPSQQPSSLSPPQFSSVSSPQLQEPKELVDEIKDVEELLEIANESSLFLFDKDFDNLW